MLCSREDLLFINIGLNFTDRNLTATLFNVCGEIPIKTSFKVRLHTRQFLADFDMFSHPITANLKRVSDLPLLF